MVCSNADFRVEAEDISSLLFLPNDRELDPDDGDERYGKLCAATYELRKADEDRTEVVRRVNNLE